MDQIGLWGQGMTKCKNDWNYRFLWKEGTLGINSHLYHHKISINITREK
jgi:hypothetical protein